MKMNTTETKYFNGCKVTLHWSSRKGAVDVTPYNELPITALDSLIKYLYKENDTYFSHYEIVLKAFDMAFTLYSGNELTTNTIKFFLTDEPNIKVSTVSVFDDCLYIELKIKP